MQFQIPDHVQRQAQNDKVEDQIGHQDGRHERFDREAFLRVHRVLQHPHVRHRVAVEQDSNGGGETPANTDQADGYGGFSEGGDDEQPTIQ